MAGLAGFGADGNPGQGASGCAHCHGLAELCQAVHGSAWQCTQLQPAAAWSLLGSELLPVVTEVSPRGTGMVINFNAMGPQSSLQSCACPQVNSWAVKGPGAFPVFPEN